MIIRNSGGRPKIPLKILIILGLVLVSICLGLLFLINNGKEDGPALQEYACGAEKVIMVEGEAMFETPNKNFALGQNQSNKMARTGSFSSEQYGDQAYGMEMYLDDLEEGDSVIISVWFYGESEGSVVIDPNYEDVVISRTFVQIDRAGWKQVLLRYRVPLTINKAKLAGSEPGGKVYTFNPGEVPGYFDDLKIRVLRNGSGVLPGNAYEGDSLIEVNLVIDNMGLEKLREKRDQALIRGLLIAEDDDWVDAKIISQDDEIDLKVRLKGDWTDHLRGDKWSFRATVKGEKTWNRMVTFSLQNPLTRNYLDEWVFHQLLQSEDVLTTRYEFCHLMLNGKSLGIYVYEEHFEKQLPEYSKRREGPILKFEENGLWEAMFRELGESPNASVMKQLPVAEASTIAPFKEGKTMATENLRQQFEIAQVLMDQFMNSRARPTEVFDVERMAKFLALTDVTMAQHGIAWHNMRFYYNPVTSRLEPIGFDGFTEIGPENTQGVPFLGFARSSRYQHPSVEIRAYVSLFLDPEFMEQYISFLYKFSRPAYLNAFYQKYNDELNEREALVKKEVPKYLYDRQFILTNALQIQKLIMPLPHVSVKAYFEGIENGKSHYKVQNFHALPVRILGIGSNPKGLPVFQAQNQPILEGFYLRPPNDEADLYFPGKGNYLYYEIPGIDSVFITSIVQWKSPLEITPAQDLFTGLQIHSNKYMVVGGDTVIFRPGKHKINADILIPANKKVIVPAGTHLDLVNGARLISRSPLTMAGTEDSPILITSSDTSSQGVAVLGAWDFSDLSYVVFENLNTLSYKGWNLTGAVTFYECQVNLDHCSFVSNHCEDALNLIRSSFKMDYCLIANTFGDGFDADFCSGFMRNCHFENTGNDAMDFSGSNIALGGCFVKNAGDKAVSVGEESSVIILSLEVDGSVMGVVSKDLSRATVDNIKLVNVQQGFAAYQKKPEFGPASIVVKKYEATNVKSLHGIQLGSKLMLVDQEITGK